MQCGLHFFTYNHAAYEQAKFKAPRKLEKKIL